MTGMHFLIGAAIFALPAAKRSWTPPVLAGLLIGYATMIRPTYLAFAPMLFLVAVPTWKGDGPWAKESLKQALLLGSGIAVAPVAFLLYGLATGTLYDWYVDTVRYIAEAAVRAAAPGAKIRYTGGSKGWVGDVAKFNYSIEKLKATGWSPKLTSNEAVELAIRENLGSEKAPAERNVEPAI